MDFSKQTILIIEDDLETLELMVETFESEFSSIYGVTDGHEAIKVFKNNKIDVIICDINLPNLNGLDVINEIRKISYSVPIIIISAYSDSETLLKASNSNIQGYITKPITSDKVENIINKIIFHQHHLSAKQNIKLNNSTILDLQNSQVTVDDKIIKFTNRESKFIELLLQNKGSLVTYKTIEQVLWYDDAKNMTSTSLRTLVKNIRKKIGLDIIENVSKMGYRIIVDNYES